MNITKHLLLAILLLINPLHGEFLAEAFMSGCGINEVNPANFSGENRDFIQRANEIIDNAIKAYYGQKLNAAITVGTVILARTAIEMHLHGSPVYIEEPMSRAHILLMAAEVKLIHECKAGQIHKTPVDMSEKEVVVEMARFYSNIVSPKGYYIWHTLICQQLSIIDRQLNKFSDIVPIAIKSLLTAATFKYLTMKNRPLETREITEQLIIGEPKALLEQITMVAKYFNNITDHDFNLLMWALLGDLLFDGLAIGYDDEVQAYVEYTKPKKSSSMPNMQSWDSLIN